MPIENIRRQMMQDPNLYPELGKPNETLSAISITSSTSSSSIPSKPSSRPASSTIVISDDEGEEENTRPRAMKQAQPHIVPLQPRADYSNIREIPQQVKLKFSAVSDSSKFPPRASKEIPIHIPSNRDIVAWPPTQAQPQMLSGDDETIAVPEFHDDNQYISPADAEKALRDLMSGSMNQDIEKEVNMEESVVKGFKEGIVLLPHQVLGRTWMRDREDTAKKRSGGILADDMGLGKTIQTLTRIVEGRARKSDRDDGWSAVTLVICPLALVGQWADEIEKMTDGITVIKHHGASRTSDSNALRKVRVVVTTYDVVKSEYEAHMRSTKDESQSKLPAKKKKSAALSDDENSDDSAEDFGRTIAAKTKKSKSPKKSALFEVQWWRIVLDEAHNIKNVKTKGAIACCELQGKYRWCLTGTPMQNNVTELYSLIKFLRIKPLSNWDTFNTQIAKPVNAGKGASRAMKRLQVVLKQIMLRRQKDQILNGKPLIELPKRTVNIISCPFDPSELAFYNALENKMEHVIEKLMSQNKGNNAYMSVLLLLLRLRQACNSPVLIAEDYKMDMDAVDPKKKNIDSKDDEADDLADAFGQLGVTRKCQVCMVELTPKNIGGEGWDTHCTDCVTLAQQAKRAKEDRPSSAKIRMILKLLKDVDERSQCEEKTIIFSQFTKMLDLIEPFLDEKGIKYVRYDGSMTADARENTLQKIKSSKSTRVILISFKAGSTGLNLTTCNNVILVDMWWNPALEDQAFDRAHRFGQTRDVNIFKLKIDETVEDRILTLQENKRKLAHAALSGDKIKNMRLGMDDLLALFRPGGRDDDEDSD